MTQLEAMEKAAKLLRLAQSSNPHEAALAASRAQEIMFRHKIETIAADYGNGAAASAAEPIRDFGSDPLDQKRATWKDRLGVTLAKLNQCKAYASGGNLNLVGCANDVANVRYFYAWLTREIERLAIIHCHGNGRTYFNNFRIGAQETVCARLQREGQHTIENIRQEAIANDLFQHATNRKALVLVEKALAHRETQLADVERWAKEKLRLRTSAGGRRHHYNSTAREAGRHAGHSIGLRPAGGQMRLQ